MYEQEKQRATHLLILLCYTFFTIVLTGEALLLGWETGAIALLLLGLAASWLIHITGKVPPSISIWLYFILTMLAFFFYGIHETSIYDLAPVMAVVILMYSVTEMESIINCCVATYYVIMLYDFVFVLGGSMELSPLSVTRLLLHLGLVFFAGCLSRYLIQRQRKERKATNDRIVELEETNRRTEDFLTNVSHELRTPINAVTGITAVMLKKEKNEETRKDIISVQNAGNRLFNQIEDILDFTELDTGRIKMSEDIYMISSIINDIITGDKLYERENAPELIFDIDATIPSVLLGDGRKIKKIIKHLIDNAVKFTKKGGVYIRIHALRKPYGINLCISVSDTGIGIPREELGKITKRFYQSNSGRNRRTGGLGLGLPIVYGMVSAMEGFMQIESTEGSGTTVSVSIPQKVSNDAPGMVVKNREALCLGCYLKPEKYEVPEVRDYYNVMISHIVQELDLTLHRVFDMDELKKLISVYQLTNLFIGNEEYEEDREYFEELNQHTDVIIVADEHFNLPAGSRIKILRKPFYSLSIVNILNAGMSEERDAFHEKRIICPDVRVLVVDDEPMNLMVAEGIFKDYQMSVTTADSGRKAIELCENNTFDLIFLDHMMPEMDGVETLKYLRKIHTDEGDALTVVAFTANAVSGAREMFLREGFDEFISKPVEVQELERVLRKLLPKSAIKFVDENYVLKADSTKHEENGETDGICMLEKNGRGRSDILKEKGIDVQAALQYCRGDMPFYEELISQFAGKFTEKETELDDFFRQEDYDNYRIRVHALKSASKMVGANTLSKMAEALEDAAKKHDADYVGSHHEELIVYYREVVQCIRDVFDIGNENSNQDAPENGTEISTDELLERLKKIKDSLDTFEIDKAEALLAEMNGMIYQGAPVNVLLSAVGQDIEDFEPSAASEKVSALICSMEGGEA